jgi:hypothetical protein
MTLGSTRIIKMSELEELKNEVLRLKDIVQKYENIFEIEDGKVFLHSSLGVRGDIRFDGEVRGGNLYDISKMARGDLTKQQYRKECEEFIAKYLKDLEERKRKESIGGGGIKWWRW